MKKSLAAFAALLFPYGSSLAGPASLFGDPAPPSIALFLSEPLKGPTAFDRVFRSFTRRYPKSARASIDASLSFLGEVKTAEGFRIVEASTITDYRNLTLDLAESPCLSIADAAEIMFAELPAGWPEDDAPNLWVERNGMEIRISAPHPRSRCVTSIVIREPAGALRQVR